MASLYSVEYKQAYVTVPYTPNTPGSNMGRLHALYANYDLADAEITTSDTLYLFKIPSGFRVLYGCAKFDDLGTTGVLDIGWEAGATAAESADPNGFISSLDVKTAADQISIAVDDADNAGLGKRFAEQVNCVVTASESTNGGATAIFEFWLLGVQH